MKQLEKHFPQLNVSIVSQDSCISAGTVHRRRCSDWADTNNIDLATFDGIEYEDFYKWNMAQLVAVWHFDSVLNVNSINRGFLLWRVVSAIH